jgi:protocatechuate 4,5-dioxygenase, alpha chain
MSVPDANLYEISRLLYDLRNPANRDAVRADAGAYYRRYAVGEGGMGLLMRRDWQGLVDIGVTVYLLTKLGAALGVTLLEIGAAMRSMSNKEFQGFIEEQNRRNRAMALLPDQAHPEKA